MRPEEESNTPTLSDRIRRRMRDLDMSQVELSRRSGVSQPYISQITTGRRGVRPGHRTVARLADALDVSPEFFYRDRVHLHQEKGQNAKVQ